MTQPSSVKAERLGKKMMISKPNRKDKCSLCSKSITLLRRASVCELSLDSVCSRCVTVRKLSYIRRNGDMVQIRTAFCKNCILWSTRVDSADIARILIVFEGRDTQVSHDLSLGGGASVSRSVPQLANEDYAMLSDDTESLHVETVDEWDLSQRQVSQDPLSQSISSSGSEKSQDPHQLLKQMNQLVLSAEQTYQLTQQNSEAMVQSTKMPLQSS